MVNLKSKHRSQNSMTQMVVAFVAGDICEQMLNSVIYMLLGGDLLVITLKEGLAVLFSAILGYLCCSKHSMGRKKMKRVWRCGLPSTLIIGYGWYIGLYAGDNRHYSSSLASSLSKQSALQDSM